MEYPQFIKSGEEGLYLITWKAIYGNLFGKKKQILFCDLTYINCIPTSKTYSNQE